ncbi:YoaK family protein [Actinomadura sp. DC4]|uniref:YoaK family protein n=1 Tax=Actinomadura sp. DC4 TaxID=3055069 RepID=UPI0025B17029|nr:YoaK family protein [Actinomadura sp. DC4]MDN3355288.1 YoaK family protein [Actinomadura sp. DC4]
MQAVILLAAGSGAVDAFSFAGLGAVFASVMTGNLVLLGVAAVHASLDPALSATASIAAYVLGVFTTAGRLRRETPGGWSFPGDAVRLRRARPAILEPDDGNRAAEGERAPDTSDAASRPRPARRSPRRVVARLRRVRRAPQLRLGRPAGSGPDDGKRRPAEPARGPDTSGAASPARNTRRGRPPSRAAGWLRRAYRSGRRSRVVGRFRGGVRPRHTDAGRASGAFGAASRARSARGFLKKAGGGRPVRHEPGAGVRGRPRRFAAGEASSPHARSLPAYARRPRRLVCGRARAPGGEAGRLWRALTVVPVAQVAVLSVWLATGGHPAAAARIVLLALSAFAMGVQSAGVNTLPLTGVATAYLTGTLTTLTTELATTGVPAAMRRRFAVLAAALAGAGLNAALFTWLRPAAPALPLAATLTVLVLLARAR